MSPDDRLANKHGLKIAMRVRATRNTAVASLRRDRHRLELVNAVRWLGTTPSMPSPCALWRGGEGAHQGPHAAGMPDAMMLTVGARSVPAESSRRHIAWCTVSTMSSSSIRDRGR